MEGFGANLLNVLLVERFVMPVKSCRAALTTEKSLTRGISATGNFTMRVLKNRGELAENSQHVFHFPCEVGGPKLKLFRIDFIWSVGKIYGFPWNLRHANRLAFLD